MKSRTEQILDAMADHDEIISPVQIAGYLGITANYVRGILQRMVRSEKVIRRETGKYILPEWIDRYPDISGHQTATLNATLPSLTGQMLATSEPTTQYGGKGDMVKIPLVVATASGGPGDVPYSEEVEQYLIFDRAAFKRQYGVNPDMVVVMRATGNSMENLISAGDHLWVVREHGEALMQSSIYVFRVYDTIVVKRYYRDGDGVQLVGDNPQARVINIKNPEIDLAVLGRVFQIVKPA